MVYRSGPLNTYTQTQENDRKEEAFRSARSAISRTKPRRLLRPDTDEYLIRPKSFMRPARTTPASTCLACVSVLYVFVYFQPLSIHRACITHTRIKDKDVYYHTRVRYGHGLPLVYVYRYRCPYIHEFIEIRRLCRT